MIRLKVSKGAVHTKVNTHSAHWEIKETQHLLNKHKSQNVTQDWKCFVKRSLSDSNLSFWVGLRNKGFLKWKWNTVVKYSSLGWDFLIPWRWTTPPNGPHPDQDEVLLHSSEMCSTLVFVSSWGFILYEVCELKNSSKLFKTYSRKVWPSSTHLSWTICYTDIIIQSWKQMQKKWK